MASNKNLEQSSQKLKTTIISSFVLQVKRGIETKHLPLLLQAPYPQQQLQKLLTNSGHNAVATQPGKLTTPSGRFSINFSYGWMWNQRNGKIELCCSQATWFMIAVFSLLLWKPTFRQSRESWMKMIFRCQMIATSSHLFNSSMQTKERQSHTPFPDWKRIVAVNAQWDWENL